MTWNSAPSPGRLSAVISPPQPVTSRWQIDSPSPVPMPTLFVVKNGTNSRFIASGVMPSPVSATVTTMRPPAPCRVRMRISFRSACPSGSAWTAFITRFRNTWLSRDSLPST